GMSKPKQLVGHIPSEHGDRTIRVDFRRTHQPAAFGIERTEVDVISRDPLDLHAVAGLPPNRRHAARLRLGGHGADVLAVFPDRHRFVERDPRVVPYSLLVGFGAHDRHALNREVVGADTRENRVGDVAVHALDERDDGDDRRDRHDVSEHGQKRSQLVRPDRAQRDHRRLVELVHFAGFDSAAGAVLIFTAAPSAIDRTDENGPVITASPSFSPDKTSKYFSPAIPVLIGLKTALLFWTMNTPSSSLRVCPGFSSAACAAVPTLGRTERFSFSGGRTTLP